MALAQKKNGGPYPKNEQRKRREEVYRLHFEYEYSARKIAEFLNVNRGTINRDIMNLYDDVSKKWRHFDPEFLMKKQIERLEIQKTRLRKLLDTAETLKEKLAIERFILDITVKIAGFQIRLAESNRYSISLAADIVNEKLQKQKINKRLVSKDLFHEVSEKARSKITKIYLDDMKF